MKSEYVPRPNTEIDLIELIANIKDEMGVTDFIHSPAE